MNKKIPVVSFFCGCGGLDLGLIGGFTYKGSDIKNFPSQSSKHMTIMRNALRLIKRTYLNTQKLRI